MSPRPQTAQGLEAEAGIGRLELRWQALPWEPLIDHYRIYSGAPRGRGREPDPEHLVGRTVFPRFVLDGLDPAGEQHSLTVIAVSDAGRLSPSSRALIAASQASVTETGTELAAIGSFDGRTHELQFAPKDYAKIPKAYPQALIEFRQGDDEPRQAWPYLLPGPGDAWASRKSYRARWVVELDEAPGTTDLALWLVDTTSLGGRLDIVVNGTPVRGIELPRGSNKGSRQGDATATGSPLKRSRHELELPAGTLRAGENYVEFVLAEGGWVAWDALGLFAR